MRITGNAHSVWEDANSQPAPVTAIARSKAVVYNVSGARGEFQEADYNLTDVAAAIDTEAYFRVAVDRLVTEIWKNGFGFVGRDQDAVMYIRRRIKQMFQVLTPDSPKPFDDFLEDISRQLVMYSNCYIEKIRNEEASGGTTWTRFDGKELMPIAALNVLDATSIQVQRKDNGTPLKYKQVIPNASKEPEWAPVNICHATAGRQVGLATGTPFVVPTLDDIRALRSMEQNVEILVFQHAVPLYHAAIGTELQPGTDDEVAVLRDKLENMPAAGALITSNRVTIVVLGSQGEAINVEPYLQYFKSRVLSGLRLGAVAVGEGNAGTRSTSSTINAVIQDVARYFQGRIRMFMGLLVDEILLEGGFVWDPGEVESLVTFFIPEIDIETKIAKENHFSQMWMDNGITSAEFRRELGRDPFTEEEWKDTYWAKIGEPKALIAAIDEQFVKPAAPPLVPGAVTKVTPTNKTTTNSNTPANQHGTRGAPKLNKDEFSDAAQAAKSLLDHLGYPGLRSTLLSIYDRMKEDAIERVARADTDPAGVKMIPMMHGLSVDSMMKVGDTFVVGAFNDGLAQVIEGPIDEGTQEKLANTLSTIRKDNVEDFIRFLGDLNKLIDTATNVEDAVGAVRPMMETIQYRLEFIARTQLAKSFNVGMAEGAKLLGDKKMDVIRLDSPDCKICPPIGSEVDLGRSIVRQDQVPPFHTNCTCILQRKVPS